MHSTTALTIALCATYAAPPPFDCVIIVSNTDNATGTTSVSAGRYNLRLMREENLVPAFVPPRRARGRYVELLPPVKHRPWHLCDAPAPAIPWPAFMRRFVRSS